jgi:CubicO group peptidase (beta-lactamase class C family)
MIAVGMSDVENKIPLSVSTHYPIQSTSKMFMTILSLQLAEEGKFTMESTIDERVGYVPNGDKIRGKDLVKNTSGLTDYQANTDFIHEYWSNMGKNIPVMISFKLDWRFQVRVDRVNSNMQIPTFTYLQIS